MSSPLSPQNVACDAALSAPSSVEHGADRCTVRALSSLSPTVIERVAHRCAVLSDPLRLRLVHALYDGEKNVSELIALTQGTQTNVSRHLHILAEEGVVRRRRMGLLVFYEIADPNIRPLCELVCDSIRRQLSEQTGAFLQGNS